MAESLLLLACLFLFFHDFCEQDSDQTTDAIEAKFHRLVDLVGE